MRNPLSAIISSPGRIRSKNPQSLVMNLSDTFPPHNFETYVMSPDGEIHTRALKVLCCLYELHVWDWAVGFLGFFIKKNFVQSIMLVTFGKLSRNDSGRNRLITFWDGHQKWCEHNSHVGNPCGEYLWHPWLQIYPPKEMLLKVNEVSLKSKLTSHIE